MAAGTTWGTYHFVGTYDGASFTVIRVDRPPPVRRPSHLEQFKYEAKSPCPEREGGWTVPDPGPAFGTVPGAGDPGGPGRAGLRRRVAVLWEPMGHNVAEEPGEFVLNVAFTGDLARHEAELRSRGGGRLRVTRQQRP
jgi:hypothetical protein